MAPLSGAIPHDSSPQVATVLRCIEAFSTYDPKVLDEVISAGYTHEVLPKSTGLHVESKTQFLKRLGKTRLLLQDFGFVIHEVIDASRKIIVHASSNGLSKTGQSYTNEYNFIFDVAKVDGEWKITHVKEFVDSKFTAMFFAEERERRRKQARDQAGSGA